MLLSAIFCYFGVVSHTSSTKKTSTDIEYRSSYANRSHIWTYGFWIVEGVKKDGIFLKWVGKAVFRGGGNLCVFFFGSAGGGMRGGGRGK